MDESARWWEWALLIVTVGVVLTVTGSALVQLMSH